MNGFIKLQRSFFSHWIWEEEKVFHKREAWLDLIQMAAFSQTKRMISGKLIELEPGEIIASLRFLAARWSWGKDKVSKFLTLLEADEMCRRETRQGETVLILCNYKKYSSFVEEKADSDTDTNQTGSRQGPDRDQTNEKKDKKDKKDKNPPSPAPAGLTVDGMIEMIPDDWEPRLKQEIALWVEVKQSGPTSKRYKTQVGWEKDLTRMGKYPAHVVIDAIDTAIAKNWQGWEQDSVKAHLNKPAINGKPKTPGTAY